MDPMSRLSRLLGVLPLRTSRNWSWLWTIYSILIIAIFIFSNLVTGRIINLEVSSTQKINNSTNKANRNEGSPLMVQRMMNSFLASTCTILVVVVHLERSRKLPALLCAMRHYDRTLNKNGRTSARRNDYRASLLGAVMCVTCTYVAVLPPLTLGFCSHILTPVSGLMFFLQDTMKMGTFAVELQFLYTVYYLFQRFKLINNNLSNLPMEDIEQIPSKIFFAKIPVEGMLRRRLYLAEAVRSHRTLCDILADIRSTFQVQLLLCSLIDVALSVSYVFLTLSLTEESVIFAMLGFLWSGHFALRIFLLGTIPGAATYQALRSRSIAVRLDHRLLETDTKQEIALLVSDVNCTDVTFSICGFFTLDKAFIRSILVAVITYVVVLMQFKQNN